NRFREGIPMLEDLLFLTDYLIHCEKVVYCPVEIYYYVRRIGSITRSDPMVFIKGLEIRKEVADKLRKEMPEVSDSAFYSYADWCIQTLNKNEGNEVVKKEVTRRIWQILPIIILSKKFSIKEKVFYFFKAISRK
ncbi:MAG: hypothetical protein IKP72_04150, partial [Clostridia bacterium]|nr:hypothetical protein [Clostridia bacterium]